MLGVPYAEEGGARLVGAVAGPAGRVRRSAQMMAVNDGRLGLGAAGGLAGADLIDHALAGSEAMVDACHEVLVGYIAAYGRPRTKAAATSRVRCSRKRQRLSPSPDDFLLPPAS